MRIIELKFNKEKKGIYASYDIIIDSLRNKFLVIDDDDKYPNIQYITIKGILNIIEKEHKIIIIDEYSPNAIEIPKDIIWRLEVEF